MGDENSLCPEKFLKRFLNSGGEAPVDGLKILNCVNQNILRLLSVLVKKTAMTTTVFSRAARILNSEAEQRTDETK